MCIAVEFFSDSERVVARGDVDGSQLPVRLRNGEVRLYRWGSSGRPRVYDAKPGYLLNWPPGGWVPLDVLKRGEWWQFKPAPVRVAAARFLVSRRDGDVAWEDWVNLKPGEYLQGALAQRHGDYRVYVVTIDPPSGDATAVPWPRVVSARRAAPR
ncbi:MAG: hypothetical protein ACXW2A_03495 [Burkholderiales bacterium]